MRGSQPDPKQSSPHRGAARDARIDANLQPGELRFGTIVGVHGLRGELRLFLHNRTSDWLDEGREVVLLAGDGARRKARLHARPGAGKRVIGRVEGVVDREGAQLLVGCEVVLARSELPETGEDTWYHHDLVGASVRSASGKDLGVLTSITASGAVDTWIVEGDEGSLYLPALREFILTVDPDEGVLVTDDWARFRL
ncbi:MAG: ribosome maturation factor RimM, partial [Myxococcota bacterium]|nr:ribosome maturation factor RimM [Myxococcota bacterium]